MSKLVAQIFAAACAALLCHGAAAQGTFPDHPVRFLVGFGAGGPTDLSVRALAAAAAKHLGQPLVVQNMPGAAGALAMAELARQPADGYTISMTTTSYRALVVHQQKPPFDLNELQTLLGYVEFRHVLFVRAESPYKTLDDLVRYGRANPGAIKFGHVGTGSSLHLQGLLFFKTLGVQVTDVPYKGSSEFTNAVLGGHVDTAFIDIAGIRALANSGRARLLVTITPQRFPEFPSVPTALELGVEGPELFNPMVGVAIRRDTPAERRAKLLEALRRASEDPEFVKAMNDIGLKSGYRTAADFDGVVSRAEARAVPLMKEVGMIK